MLLKLTLAATAALLIAGHASATEYAIEDLTAKYGEGYTWSRVNNAGELAGYRGDGNRTIELRLRSGSVSFKGTNLLFPAPSAFANDGTLYFSGFKYDAFGNEIYYSKRRDLDGTITQMPTPGRDYGLPSRVTAVNDHGIAVGSAMDEHGDNRAVIYQDGKATAFGPANDPTMIATGINNHGAVVAHDDYTSYLYADGKLTTFAPYVQARHINDANVVAGSRRDADGNWSAFLYKGGVFTDIPVAGASRSETIDLNNSGMVLGWAWDYAGQAGIQYFLYANGETILLNDIVAAQGYAGWYVSASDINDSGQILLTLSRDFGSESRELLLTPTLPVPEPRAWAMLLAGLACVGMVKRRARAA